MYQNCKFHISHYSEYVFSSYLLIYFTLIAIMLKDYDAAFLYNCSFLFIIIMGLLIWKYAPFWLEFSVKYLILRWPLRLVGLLFMMHQKAVLFQDINQARDKLNSSDPLVMKSWLIDWLVFYAVSAIFLPFNAGDY